MSVAAESNSSCASKQRLCSAALACVWGRRAAWLEPKAQVKL